MRNTILCYSDSNTWGYVPTVVASKTIERYSYNIRWPGVLQTLLGKDYYVVEEGLNGRTTNLDFHIAPNRNGKMYLSSCLYSHAPIELVILALGANDFKTYFNRKPKDIRNGLAELINIIQTSTYGAKMKVAPKILIIPPFVSLPSIEQYIDENGIVFFKGAIKKSQLLIEQYAALAEEKTVIFSMFLNIFFHQKLMDCI